MLKVKSVSDYSTQGFLVGFSISPTWGLKHLWGREFFINNYTQRNSTEYTTYHPHIQNTHLHAALRQPAKHIPHQLDLLLLSGPFLAYLCSDFGVF